MSFTLNVRLRLRCNTYGLFTFTGWTRGRRPLRTKTVSISCTFWQIMANGMLVPLHFSPKGWRRRFEPTVPIPIPIIYYTTFTFSDCDVAAASKSNLLLWCCTVTPSISNCDLFYCCWGSFATHLVAISQRCRGHVTVTGCKWDLSKGI